MTGPPRAVLDPQSLRFTVSRCPPPQWHIESTCATQGTGLYEGLDWLSKELSK